MARGKRKTPTKIDNKEQEIKMVNEEKEIERRNGDRNVGMIGRKSAREIPCGKKTVIVVRRIL